METSYCACVLLVGFCACHYLQVHGLLNIEELLEMRYALNILHTPINFAEVGKPETVKVVVLLKGCRKLKITMLIFFSCCGIVNSVIGFLTTVC